MIINETDLIDLTAVGHRIKTIRDDFKCSMEQFGRLVGGTSKAAVYNWEHGKRLPNEDSLELIAILGKVTVLQLLYGNIEDYIFSLFDIKSKSYQRIKKIYEKLGNSELFSLYELASSGIRQTIIDRLVHKTQESDWTYSDIHHITDSFLIVADNILKTNRYAENFLPKIEELLNCIEKQHLSDRQLDILLEYIHSYLKK